MALWIFDCYSIDYSTRTLKLGIAVCCMAVRLTTRWDYVLILTLLILINHFLEDELGDGNLLAEDQSNPKTYWHNKTVMVERSLERPTFYPYLLLSFFLFLFIYLFISLSGFFFIFLFFIFFLLSLPQQWFSPQWKGNDSLSDWKVWGWLKGSRHEKLKKTTLVASKESKRSPARRWPRFSFQLRWTDWQISREYCNYHSESL